MNWAIGRTEGGGTFAAATTVAYGRRSAGRGPSLRRRSRQFFGPAAGRLFARTSQKRDLHECGTTR